MNIHEAQRAVNEELAQHHDTMIQFLRDIVAIPSYDSQIGPVCDAIGARMADLGFDEVRRDAMGNILGRIGNGPRVLLYDSHIDTVGVGDPAQWQWDPFKGKLENGIIYGLGAGDEKCSTPPMIYALATLKKLGLARDWTLYYFGNMEEWCDGISGNALVEHEGIRPDFVVIGEPTEMQIFRGHRGRTEISVTFKGRSCHASEPERGDNALYKAIPFIQGIERLHQELKTRPDPFLGAGSITVTNASTVTPSLNAVPNECSLYIDRRMHPAETKEVILRELAGLPNADQAEIVIPMYEEPSYTGFVFPVEKVFPAWALPEAHPLVEAGKATFASCYGQPPKISKWVFSTNATYWMGKAGIPSIGFGPGEERWAHSVLDQVPAEEVAQCATFYAMLPLFLNE
ncbi:MAG TPA: YgeY family selenium metabolism-linked hydrolase [Ktedonobacteraceae bacterium]|nr:YgeY family selenium metabolism-linked hydrolase [Ktedonobacteraceae bacterium]